MLHDNNRHGHRVTKKEEKEAAEMFIFKQSVVKHNKTDKSKEVREKRNDENTMN